MATLPHEQEKLRFVHLLSSSTTCYFRVRSHSDRLFLSMLVVLTTSAVWYSIPGCNSEVDEPSPMVDAANDDCGEVLAPRYCTED
jgi:hypothetical protein